MAYVRVLMTADYQRRVKGDHGAVAHRKGEHYLVSENVAETMADAGVIEIDEAPAKTRKALEQRTAAARASIAAQESARRAQQDAADRLAGVPLPAARVEVDQKAVDRLAGLGAVLPSVEVDQAKVDELAGVKPKARPKG